MINIGMISAWHVHAEDYANELKASGKARVAAVWDGDEKRGAEFAAAYGAEFIPDYDEFISRGDIAAVVCNSPTTMHPGLLIKAAVAGKHIFTEKLLATNTLECEQICEAIRKSGVTFTISLPLRTNSKMLYAKKLADSGALGRVTGGRMRRSHSGVSDKWLPERWFDVSQTGGGAMMDLGAHPVYLMSFLFGAPVRISGLMSNPYGTSSDENAVALAEFQGGVIASCETAFVTYGVPDILEVYGTEGSLFIWGDEVKLAARANTGACLVKPSDLPPEKPSPLIQFVDACINGTGTPEHLGLEDALIMTKMIEAAYISDRENKIVIF
ncbi:MAG: Gfo/Idh/MocA family oxidoreductase [Defluviitaleaceae bacterium]|nr:Gfo/Idh/MocA family oxidoreductase [Defluviitaleaceae bacterium]MCL2836382.1 Gfo/Idh/MocA family oxidoreductase [Defluviitaleaceae bacterium]